MALLFCDGMDAYGVVGDLPRKGWQGVGSVPINGSFFVSASAGAYGGGAIGITSTSSSPAICRYGMFTPVAGGVINAGLMFKQSAPPSGPIASALNQGGIFLFTIDAPNNADTYNGIGFDASGHINFYPLGSATPNATHGTRNVCDNAWHWIEMQLVQSTTASGSVQVYVDGTLDLSLTGIVTVSGSINGGIGFGSGSSNASASVANWFDDYVVWDNSGSKFNTFPIGQQRITTLNPNAAGDLAQFTPSAGANFAVAAQAYAATATLTSATAGQTDLYNTSGMGGFSPASIGALVLNCYADNPAGGTFTEIPKVKSLGTVASNAAIALPATPATTQSMFYGDSSAAAWTATSVNAAQIGMGT
jgi:hypothetical protein